MSTLDSQKTVRWFDLGLTSYRPAWELQKKLQKLLIDEKIRARNNPDIPRTADMLLFVEHPHVYTLGKSGDAAHLLASDEELKNRQAEFVNIDRGGDITYHGPGQIVGYPVFDLDRHFTDIHKYLRCLEDVLIRVCGDYGLNATRVEKLTGVWIGNQKIAAMGIKCSRWVTMHGFAFNVNTRLDYFGSIVPCGISDRGVTSLQQLLGRHVDEDEVKQCILHHLADVFSVATEPLESLPVPFSEKLGFSDEN